MGYFKTTPAGTGPLGKFGDGVDAAILRSGNRAQRRLIAKHDREVARREAVEEARKAARLKGQNP